jgi:hypothetical protein
MSDFSKYVLIAVVAVVVIGVVAFSMYDGTGTTTPPAQTQGQTPATK